MDGFSQFLVMCNKVSESRVNMYVNLVRKFHNYVGKPYVDIKESDVRKYLSSLKKQQQLKRRSVYLHFEAIKMFYQYLLRRGEIVKVPLEGIKVTYWKSISTKSDKKSPVPSN
jgi:site-specific recombinase XerD